MTTRWRWSPRRKCAPAAWPTRSAVSAVIGSLLVVPRIPSVPKHLRVIAAPVARLADPAPDSGGHWVQPRPDQEEQRPSDQRNGTGIGHSMGEGDESGLRGPLMEALAHQF